jgi:hypothetical protein
MAAAVFLLCAATALCCAVLLLRAYRRRRVRLLLWSGLCFLGLAADNAMLFIDVVVFPETDLSMARRMPGLIGVGVLVYGLVWESG